MNKEEILRRSQRDSQKEIDEYIDNKALSLASFVFVLLCIFMLIASFASTIQNEIIYTTLSLLSTYASIYCFARYYYFKIKVNLIIGWISLLLALYSISQVWLIIW